VLTRFLFAHIVAEVCDASALVVIALGFSKRISPTPLLVPGAAQHR
jgi:Na+/H+ antiporter NhaA